jgi:purine-binding chemotaxis protein CheW
VVSLRALFNLPRKEFDERTRVVVFNVQTAGGTHTVGVTVDAVAEVLRVPRSVIEDVPAALRGQQTEEILGVCKIQEGRRLVYLLDPTKLLPLEEIGEFASVQAEDERTVHQSASEEEEHLVTFQLNGQEYAVNIGQVQEIIRLPAIVAVPKAPDFVEGVINLRGTVIPVIDLRARFGLPAKDDDEQVRVVVVDIGGVKTGCKVDSVREVLKIPRGDIEKISEICTGGARFFRGVGKIEKADRMIIILDLAEILSGEEKEELANMEVSD